MESVQLFNIKGSSREHKIPLGLKHIKAKKICVNRTKLEQLARKRVRDILKYKRSMRIMEGRKMKEMMNMFQE